MIQDRIITVAFSLILLFSCSCNSSTSCGNGSSLPVVDIEYALENGGDEVALSKFCSSIEYIPLETKEGCYVGYKKNSNDQHITGDDSGLYYLDGSSGLTKKFDYKGKYITEIGTIGRSENEYLRATFALIDEGKYHIFDMDGKKILAYDDNGNVVSSLDLNDYKQKLHLRAFMAYKNKDHIYIGGSSMQRNGIFAIADTVGNVLYADSLVCIAKPGNLDEKAVAQKKAYLVSIVCGLFPYKDTMNILYTFSDTIKGYSFSSALECRDRFTINMGKEAGIPDGSNFDYCVRLLNGIHLECDRFLTLTVWYGVAPLRRYMKYTNHQRKSAVLPVYYDKVGRNTFFLPYNEQIGDYAFKNDLDNGIPFVANNMKDNKLYQIIDAETFIELAKECGSDKAKQIASKLTYDSNPVVIVATLK